MNTERFCPPIWLKNFNKSFNAHHISYIKSFLYYEFKNYYFNEGQPVFDLTDYSTYREFKKNNDGYAYDEAISYFDSFAQKLGCERLNTVCAFDETKELGLLSENIIYISNDTIYFVWLLNGKKSIEFAFEIYSIDKNKILLCSEIEDRINKPENSPQILVVVDGDSGPVTKSIGRPSVSITRENYSENVLTDYDIAIKNFNKETPFGRLLIFHGEPGTGKTFLLRSALTDLNSDNAVFIMLSPDIIQRYSASTLMKVFLDACKNNEKLYLFIEDADSCMVSRGTDNMSAISLLLNFADGIVGSLLDIRIILTTNANKLDIDKALMRPGRLNKIIEVGTLTAEEANKCYFKLTEKIGGFTSPITLAEIYDIANNGEQLKTPLPQRSIGFIRSTNKSNDDSVILNKKD